MRILVAVNGDAGSGPPPLPFDVIIAADGGARLCRLAGLRPDLVVGDMDSLPSEDRQRLAALNTRFLVHPDPVNKEETDLELALAAAVAMNPDEIVLWGMWGDRPDHTLANVLALAHPLLKGRRAKAYARGWWFQLVRPGEPAVLDVENGAIVSLIPLARVTGIETAGLLYPLPAPWEKHGGRLEFGSGRGISNIVAAAPASVRCGRGTLLVVYQSAPVGQGETENGGRS